MGASYLTLTIYCLYIEKFGFFSNAIFGSMLVYFTVFCIKRQFGSYKKLLVNFQVIGFIFASFDYIFPTLLHTYNNALVYFTFPNSLFSNFFLKIMIGTYTGIFSATICLLAIQFLYRYFAVFDSTKLVYFNGWYYLAWIVYYCFFGFLWGFAVVYFFAIDDYGLRYLSKEIFEKYERNVSEIPIMALISYDEKGDIQWKCLVGLMTITAISVVQYSVISVCAFKMYDNMKEKLSSMSPLHRRIHRQFFKALLIQTFAPTVCLFSPAFFMLSVPYADLEISFPSSVFSSVFTVYPAIDSICIMTCVSEYGRCFRKLVQSMKRKYLEKPSGDKNTQIANISDTMRQTPTTPV